MEGKVEKGICYIKNEFLLEDSIIPSIKLDEVNNKRKNENSENFENDSDKYRKLSKKGRKRGQNRNRPVYKEDRFLHICNSLINGPSNEKCSTPNCRYVHDLNEYLINKGEDLVGECYVYKTKGFCPRGVTCRFATNHLDENKHNTKSDNYDESKFKTTYNGITSNMQSTLRKREYDFSKCKMLVKHFEDLPHQQKEQTEKCLGSVSDDIESKGRDDAKQIKPVDFKDKLVLSPLTTVGNLPFRRICKEYGADITCGEMACAVPLVKGLTQEWALTKRHESEDVFGVQLCGNNPVIISQTAQLIQENIKVDYIDLNIGCPIDLIYQQGGGSALMRRTNVLELTVRTCSALNPYIPFTVKTRTGVYADKSVAHELVPLIEEWGASALTIHGRSREQRYTKSANWSYIEQCAQKANKMPIIGNGDILSYEDYTERRKIAPHVSSVMIGRGALIKPWIFEEIKQQKSMDPTSSERFAMLQKYVNYGLEHWGSDTRGIETTRRFLLEWQSFLYRYIPYELMLYPPQLINQRPQKFRCRDEMETLMSSSNSSDWVKLSEMLLGRVPEGFTFVPKHKANSY